MKVDVKTINHIAALAKLKFGEDDAERFAEEFKEILEHFNNLDQEDLLHEDRNPANGREASLREDTLETFENKEELFKNTKDFVDKYILIPKVIE